MALNYTKPLATDTQGNDLQDFGIPFKAIARYATNNPTASSVITLNDNTTSVDVYAAGQSVAIRWVPATETASVSPFASVITGGTTPNFDYVVPQNYYRRFVVPIETQGVNSIVGLGVQAGTYRRLAVISAATASSILVSEF
jgi:hypothetical protein